MGKLYIDYLDGRYIYACVHCHTHFVDAENLISKVKIKYKCNSIFRTFMERLAKLIYFRTCNYTLNPWNDSVNVYLGPEAEKIMMTGLHRVSDIFCKMCFKLAGWTYVRKKISYSHRSMPMSSQRSTRLASLSLKGRMSQKYNSIQFKIRLKTRKIKLRKIVE